MAHHLKLYDTGLQQQTTLLSLDHFMYAPSFTPDGNQIVVGVNGNLYITDLNDPKLSPIDIDLPDGTIAHFALMPDGKTLLLNLGRNYAFTLAKCSINGGKVHPIKGNQNRYWPSFQPNTNNALFVSPVGMQKAAFWMYQDGKDVRQITDTYDDLVAPVRSTYEKELWFSACTDGKWDLYKKRGDSDAIKVLDEATNNLYPCPIPSGYNILYVAFDHAPPIGAHPTFGKYMVTNTVGSEPVFLFEALVAFGSVTPNCWDPHGVSFVYVFPDLD